MNEIAELERRITAAMNRIASGIEGLVAPAPAPAANDAEVQDLREALEAERAASAQLTERVRAIKDKQETIVAGLERQVRRLAEELDIAQAELRRQMRAADDLIAANKALTTGADAPGEAAVGLAQAAELEALRAARSAERAELRTIMAELKPLIGEVA